MPTQTQRLNLTKPDQGNNDWKPELDLWADKLDQAAANYLAIHLGGVAVDEEIILDGFQFDEDVDITKVTLYAREAPVGANFTIDFLKDQVAQVKTASLVDGNKKGNAAIAGLSYLKTEQFGIQVTSVGATTAGAEIAIQVHYHIKPVI